MPTKHTSNWLIAAVLFTPLLISFWLDLTLSNLESWLTIHILASIGTLILVTLKIVPHMLIDFREYA
jgi:hypothetical protein